MKHCTGTMEDCIGSTGHCTGLWRIEAVQPGIAPVGEPLKRCNGALQRYVDAVGAARRGWSREGRALFIDKAGLTMDKELLTSVGMHLTVVNGGLSMVGERLAGARLILAVNKAALFMVRAGLTVVEEGISI